MSNSKKRTQIERQQNHADNQERSKTNKVKEVSCEYEVVPPDINDEHMYLSKYVTLVCDYTSHVLPSMSNLFFDLDKAEFDFKVSSVFLQRHMKSQD